MKLIIINNHIKDRVGGSEYQCALLADWFYKKGHSVNYLAMNGSQPTNSYNYKIINLNANNFVYIEEKIREINPNIVYYRYDLRGLKKVEKLKHKIDFKLVFAVSSILNLTLFSTFKVIDFSSPFQFIKSIYAYLKEVIRNAINFRSLKKVDGIICQTNDQVKVAKKIANKHQRIVQVNNSIEINTKINDFSFEGKSYFVWIGTVKEWKRPELYIKLARDLLEYDINFLMLGRIHSDKYQWIKQKNNLPQNCHYLGHKSHSELNSIISGSLGLIHTAKDYEGFPNVFINSWILGKPVLSLSVDPDELLSKSDIGYKANSYDSLVEMVYQIWDDVALREQTGKNAREFAKKNFDKETNIKEVEIFLSII